MSNAPYIEDQPGSSRPESHRLRQVAESFGEDPDRYDRARPHYPAALVERIAADAPGPDVLDVGCGTGIAARQFRAAGCTVLGVEPDTRMADFARASGIEVEVATFEAWEPAGRRFDAVIAGQSWHWVDPVSGAAKAARVLRPGGRLAVFAHVFEPPPDVAAAFTAVHRRVAPDSPVGLPQGTSLREAYQGGFTKYAEAIREAGGFGDPEQLQFDWERSYTRDQWLDLLPTTGGLTRLPADKVAEVLTEVGAVIDAMGGGFRTPFTTFAIVAARTDAT
ncbi:class I SAM-dependent methyltransferase [Nocardia sp. NPDC051570]|uniref:class I SAM-dependent methyltransferase n=1 Tax=Nocardia sp. NPDC051570 TaxID=3364324 RepID=UPI00379BEEBE